MPQLINRINGIDRRLFFSDLNLQVRQVTFIQDLIKLVLKVLLNQFLTLRNVDVINL